MKMTEIYFFDTYAIIEVLKGNSLYLKFKYAKIVITIFNLIELHYILLRDFNKQLADKILNEYYNFVVDVDIDTIREANEFKLVNKKKKMSAADCIGYITAQKLGIKFLTGDMHFKKVKGVEFVR